MKHRILVILACMAMALAFASVVAAATQGSCAANDTSKVLLYENQSGDTGDNDDRLWVCGNVAQLPDHTLPGDCASLWPNEPTWNNCVSSFSAYLPAHTRLCFYNGGTYTYWIDWRQNSSGSTVIIPRTNIAHPDTLQSLRWIAAGSNC